MFQKLNMWVWVEIETEILGMGVWKRKEGLECKEGGTFWSFPNDEEDQNHMNNKKC